MILLYDMQAVMGVLGHLQERSCYTYALTILKLCDLTNYEGVVPRSCIIMGVFWSHHGIMILLIMIYPSYALESGSILMPNLQSFFSFCIVVWCKILLVVHPRNLT